MRLMGGRQRSGQQLGAQELRRTAERWWLFLLLGIAAVAVGVILVLDVTTAVRTLALLVGLSLLVTGLLDLSAPHRFSPRWLGFLSGALFVAAGVVALVWPGVTLRAVAVVAGIGLVAGGLLRVAGGLSDRSHRWWWVLLLGGVLSIVAGVLTLVWPGITILALALLLGIRTVLLGIAEIGFAMFLRQVRDRVA
jgi:uncharacterized membrane protein HdeD (DUF308 family)